MAQNKYIITWVLISAPIQLSSSLQWHLNIPLCMVVQYHIYGYDMLSHTVITKAVHSCLPDYSDITTVSFIYLTYIPSISCRVQGSTAIPVVWMQIKSYVLGIRSDLNDMTDNRILAIQYFICLESPGIQLLLVQLQHDRNPWSSG